MVSGAAWIDRDGDGRPELVVVGEWMPVRLFAFERGHFVDRSADAGLTGTEGWWNSITVGDLDGDGRQDLVLGNLGLNAWVKASAAEPARLYVHDFGDNGVVEQILTFYRNGKSYPLAGRDDIVKLIPALRSKYPSFKSWGASTVEDIFPSAELRRATVLEARQMATSVAMLDADGRFTLQPLPMQAQFAPVHAALVRDFDGDGKPDLLLAGNEYRVPPVLGRYDASHGLLLRGTGGGRFAVIDDAEGGPVIEGEVRALASLRTTGGVPLVVVARNDDRLELLRPTASKRATLATR
jgi:hypothetical protein